MKELKQKSFKVTILTNLTGEIKNMKINEIVEYLKNNEVEKITIKNKISLQTRRF